MQVRLLPANQAFELGAAGLGPGDARPADVR
jgi:hypothetical protein